jgi:hypothetical protein
VGPVLRGAPCYLHIKIYVYTYNICRKCFPRFRRCNWTHSQILVWTLRKVASLYKQTFVLSSIIQLTFVKKTRCKFFEARTKFLNIILRSFVLSRRPSSLQTITPPILYSFPNFGRQYPVGISLICPYTWTPKNRREHFWVQKEYISSN